MMAPWRHVRVHVGFMHTLATGYDNSLLAGTPLIDQTFDRPWKNTLPSCVHFLRIATSEDAHKRWVRWQVHNFLGSLLC
jgi:hypothetical protein